jgi:hypothetical protein
MSIGTSWVHVSQGDRALAPAQYEADRVYCPEEVEKERLSVEMTPNM